MGLAMASFLESGFKGKSRQLSGRSCALGFTFTTHPGDLIFFFLLPSYFLIPLEQNVSLSLFFFSLSWLSVLSSSSTPRCPLHYLNWSSTLYPNHYHTSVNMHFSLFIVAGLSAIATALPQRPGGGQGRFRGGRPSHQSAPDGGVQGTDLSGFQSPQTGATPGNAQVGVGQGVASEGNLNNQGQAPQNAQGDLANQGTGNVNHNGTLTGNAGENQDQNTPSPSDGNQNGQNQNGGNQDGANQATGGFDAALVPEFGIEAGQGPDGKGNCLGLNNVKIPCSCPPDRQDFIQKVQAAAAAGNSEGVPVEFPLDDSSASKKARIQTSIIVLQNLNGRGVGCPAAATTFLAQQAAA
jgi:hypothetical protein